jgi:hypothetical protein
MLPYLRRVLRLSLVLVVLAVILPAGAGAAPRAAEPTVLYHETHVWQPQEQAPYYAALARFFVPAPPGYVDFSFGHCAMSAWGCMYWTQDHATVRLTAKGRTDPFIFAHEMGHVFDMYVLAPTHFRARFSALLGEKEWVTPHSEEYFADTYAFCALHRHLSGTWTTGYGLKLTPRLHDQSCRLIQAAYTAWQALEPRPYGQSGP